MSRKINHKDKVNNFVALPGESVSRFWDMFISVRERRPKPPH